MLDVVHEDSSLLVVNKPAGLVCHPTKDGETSSLIGRVRLYLGHAEGRLINRLDRETSGLVVIGKDAVTAGGLGKLFAGSSVTKHYWAIVHGHVETDRIMDIDGAIGKDTASAVVIKDCVRADGAPALTRIAVIERLSYEGRPMTWLLVMPATGRKHQIRIHLAHIGHPIVGDKIYGGDEGRYLRFVAGVQTPDDRQALIVANHALHAQALRFTWRDERWAFRVEPDAAFGAMLTSCRS